MSQCTVNTTLHYRDRPISVQSNQSTKLITLSYAQKPTLQKR